MRLAALARDAVNLGNWLNIDAVRSELMPQIPFLTSNSTLPAAQMLIPSIG
jgi:hypothetical protein